MTQLLASIAAAASIADAFAAAMVDPATFATLSEAVDDPVLVMWLRTHRKAIGAGAVDEAITLMRRRAAKAEDDRRRANRQSRAQSGDNGPTPTIGDALGRTDLPRLEVPPGWMCDRGGISKLVEKKIDGEDVVVPVRVSHRAIVTSGVLIGVDAGDREIVIEWPDDRGDGWSSAVVRASSTQDPKAFVLLRDRGAPVARRNAIDLAHWLDEVEHWNADRIPRAWHTSRLGWQGEGGKLGYVWGRKLLTAGGESSCDAPPGEWKDDHVRLAIPEADGRQQLAEGCAARGTWEGWRDSIAAVVDYPRVMIGVYGSLAACVLGIVPAAPSAIIDWSGETSRGKTTTLAVAASVWGRPELKGAGVMRTWDVSASALESLAEACTDLPLILDDTKRATTRGRSEDVASLLYQVAAGQGRGRGRPDGMRRTATWRTILLSTGEAPATSWTQDAGARARVLSLVGAPIPDGSEKLVQGLEVGIRENYGHAGPQFVRWLLDHPAAAAKIRDRYAASCAKWAVAVDAGPVGSRLAQILALLEIGAVALHDVLGVHRPALDPIATVAVNACRAGALDADRPREALRAVYEWAASRPHEFWGRHAEGKEGEPLRPPSRGWAGVWYRGHDWTEIAFLPACLRRVLVHHGYSPDDVLPRWRERGWTVGDEGDSGTQKRMIGEDRIRHVILRRGTIDHAAGIERTQLGD
jgi:hypothetical protein